MKLRALFTCALAAVLAASLAVADGTAPQTMEMGTGPTLVLVPSITGTRLDWLPTVKRLRDRYHCVMVDLPGEGASPLPDPFSLSAAAALLDGVVAKQRPESTVVVGVGVGGTLALIAAGAHPEHQRGVMLVNASIKSPVPIPDQQRDQLLKFMDENYDQFSKMMFSRLGRDSVESAQQYALMAALPPRTVKAYFGSFFGMDANKEYRDLKPALGFVFTDKGWDKGASPGTVLRRFGYEDTTGVTPLRLANAGPTPMKDQPDSLAAMIDAFAAARFAAKK